MSTTNRFVLILLSLKFGLNTPPSDTKNFSCYTCIGYGNDYYSHYDLDNTILSTCSDMRPEITFTMSFDINALTSDSNK